LQTTSLKNMSPFEKLFSQTLDYHYLKVFGCTCFPNLRPYNSHKFSLRSKPCVFLGYSSHHKGYKCFHSEMDRIFISRDVIFHEEVFPFSHKNSSSESSPPNPPSYSPVSVSLPFSTPRDLDSYSPITFPSSSPPILPSTSPSTRPPTTPSSSPAEPDVNPALTPPRIHPMRTRS